MIVISFEFYLFKIDEQCVQFDCIVSRLKVFVFEYVLCMFGVGGLIFSYIFEMVCYFNQYYGFEVVLYLFCVGGSCEEICELFKLYCVIGCCCIVVLCGDLLLGMGYFGDLCYVVELISFICVEYGDVFCIEVGVYFEMYLQVNDVLLDLKYFKVKIDVGVDVVIIQYFFNVDVYFYFVDVVCRLGVSVLIVLGIMLIFNFSQLCWFFEQCGVEILCWIGKCMQVYGDDVELVCVFGVEVVVSLCEWLVVGGVLGLYFYIFNLVKFIIQVLKLLCG